MKAEMFYGMGFKEYRDKTDFVSVSELKLFADSPYSYKQKYLDKAQPEEYKPSRSQEFGTLCHALLEDKFAFNELYFISDVRKDERTKAYQAAKEEAGHKTIISPADFERASACVAATEKKMMGDGFKLSDLKKEVSMLVEKHKIFPLKAKGRMDLYDSERDTIIDYKTTEAMPDHETVEKQILNFKYYWQAAFYSDLHKAVTGRKAKDFVWVFQQTNFPFATAIYYTNQELIDIGRIEYQEKMKELKNSLKELDFPVMRRQPRYVSLPRFYVSKYITKCDAVDMKQEGETHGL